MESRLRKLFFDEDYFDGKGKSGYRGTYTLDDFFFCFLEITDMLTNQYDIRSHLDLGCAKGFFMYAFLEYKVESFGVDLSSYGLSESVERVKGRLCLCDFEEGTLPFKENCFDIVTCTEVLEHIQRFGPFLDEVKRILRPKGVVYLTTPSRESFRHKDPSHCNVHPWSFWVEVFKAKGLCLEDKNIYKLLVKAVIDGYSAQPGGNFIGDLLNKWRRPGRLMRKAANWIDVSLHYRTNIFLLRNIK